MWVDDCEILGLQWCLFSIGMDCEPYTRLQLKMSWH